MPLTKLSMSSSIGLLRSLAAIRRVEILDALRDGSKSVGQLVARDLGCQSGVSKHRQILHGCGPVNRRKMGQYVVYSISPAIRRLCIELDAVTKCALKRRLGQ
jgi:DNA-binding transcriptional ArsR family regulator